MHEELIATLGGESGKLAMSSKPPTVVMLCGLQGSGKTTAAGKLARQLKSQGLGVLLVAADLQRPAAVEQLRVLGPPPRRPRVLRARRRRRRRVTATSSPSPAGCTTKRPASARTS